jgi:hypothetical protein
MHPFLIKIIVAPFKSLFKNGECAIEILRKPRNFCKLLYAEMLAKRKKFCKKCEIEENFLRSITAEWLYYFFLSLF